MSGFLDRYDFVFGKQIATLAGLLLANFVCALIVMILFQDQDPAQRAIVQMATIAVISMLSCVVLLRMNNSRIAAVEAFDTLVVKDKLTGLTSREVFQSQLFERTVEESEDTPFALILFDIDRFKELNAFLGHKAADQILLQLAGRLEELADDELDAARLSGDEFGLLVLYDGNEQDLEKQMRQVFERLYKPYQLGNQSVELTMSAGIALFPDDGLEAGELYQHAQIAMQRAKQEGPDQICCYDEVVDPKLMDEHLLSQDMDRAIREDEFKLFYQPQFDFDTGKHVGYEVLIRWQHRERGLISPAMFIPIAENNGLILKLSDFLLRTACETAASWEQPLKVAINLSPVQMRNHQIADQIMQILLDTGLDPKRVELEVTESLFIDINDQITADLKRLQKLGISIALDDFGTGYSSLAYLTSFPFDKIKIDKSFVENMANDDGKIAIISAIVGLAKSLNMRITAEGIEEETSYELLRIAGCNEAQGYLLGKPRDLEEDGLIEMHPVFQEKVA